MKTPLQTIHRPRTEGKLSPDEYSVKTRGNDVRDIPWKKPIIINVIMICPIVLSKAKP